MVRITEDMVRKRSEHNEMQISTLEEISLHQQDIERLEYLDKWCRDLKILYLQSNLIPKIENVARLKKLEYINLALNNIEKIENLEGCESLKKLDLTVNFVGELTSVQSLKNLYNFRELFLTGNPCADFEHYREYVIATLPQLQWLDGREIEKSERIQAVQDLPFIQGFILEQQNRYLKKRAREKYEASKQPQAGEENGDNSTNPDESGNKENCGKGDGRWYTHINEEDQPKDSLIELSKDKTHEEKVDDFWQQKTSYTPESRIEVHNHLKELKEKEDKKNAPDQKPQRKYFADDGRPFNVNEPKVDFSLTEDDQNVNLDVSVFKHMDTSMLDCDVQPLYVRVTLKGKILQLALPEEVSVVNSKAQRSQVTGHLVITMPKIKPVLRPKQSQTETKTATKTVQSAEKKERQVPGQSYLEVDENARSGPDIAGIVHSQTASKAPFSGHAGRRREVEERQNSEGFVDDPDVPPLE
ncbi:protein tilb homolog [Plakobranchus ocellatus]|uniref:Protein tilb homolog n=1 Tax=Plakobranchus ocellatus TaxID=259542 RepID=A0AAV3Y4Q2_9GAST|nr:protein tilb homolog [Plakobranchus ocellatus]